MAGLGSGIGHQGVFDKDYSGFEALEKDYYIKGAEKAKKAKEKDDFIKATDFKQDRTTTLPMYSKAMVEVQSGFYNRMAAAKQSDNPNAMTVMHEDFQNTRQELERLAYNNKLARGYMEQDPTKFWVETDITKMLMNPKGTLADLESINDGIYFQTAPDGGFNAKHVPKADRSQYINWTSADYNKSVMQPGATPTGIRGQRKITHTKSVGDEVYANRVEMMNENPVIISENAYLDFKQTGKHRNSLEEYKAVNHRLNTEWIAAHKAPNATEEKPYNERDPKEEKAGREAFGMGYDELVANNYVTEDATALRMVKKNELSEGVKNIDLLFQKVGDLPRSETGLKSIKLDAHQPLVKTTVIGFDNSEHFINIETGQPFDKAKHYTFKAGNNVVMKGPDGITRAYTVGVAKEGFQDELSLNEQIDLKGDPKKSDQKTYGVIVPLQYAINGAREFNNVNWTDEKLAKLVKNEGRKVEFLRRNPDKDKY